MNDLKHNPPAPPASQRGAWHSVKRALLELYFALNKAIGWAWLKRRALVGEIDNKVFVDGAEVDDPVIGKSMSFPMVQEIVVDKERSAPAGVGKKVDAVFFQGAPKLVFNVAFSCGKAGPFSPGVYGDPRSIWFNVFFGYYEIDVSKAQWGRPFGYNADGTVCWEDVLKIGKADWNYFSNWVYGVPDHHVRPTNRIDDPLTKTTLHPRAQVGERFFDLLEVNHAEVVTAYLSKQDDERLIDEDLLFSPLWRVAFGQPCPRPEFKKSFFPVRMTAQLYMCFDEATDDPDWKEPIYRTFLFGGTLNEDWADTPEKKAENARFLALQMAAVRKVMTNSYRDVGFKKP